MKNYLESIQSIDAPGTAIYEQQQPNSTVILEVKGDVTSTTSASPLPYQEEISQSSVSYSAPKNVIVRTYRLRK